jgi:hypothetical protein
MYSSIIEPGSVASNIYESQPNTVYQRQRAATFSFPSEVPLSFSSSSNRKGYRKRRSKHELVGRDFKCEHCSKSYLSYPALYIHTKTKHESDPLPSRSATSKLRKASESLKLGTFAEYFGTPERRGTTPEPLETLLRAIEKLNTQLNWGLDNLSEHPLVKAMKKEEAENTCDWVLAEYCKTVAKLTNADYFEKVCSFALGYRECLNKYGWEKFGEHKQEESKSERYNSDSPRVEPLLEFDEEYQKRIKEEYSASNSLERLPELSNEFVLLFSRKYELGVDEKELIAITMNLCNWLYINKYTNVQVSFIN